MFKYCALDYCCELRWAFVKIFALKQKKVSLREEEVTVENFYANES